jgi:hypothetical protein
VEYGNTADKTEGTDDARRSSGGSGGSGGNAANSDAIVPCTIVLGDTMPWRKENPAFPSGGAEGMKEGVSGGVSVKAGDATTPAGATGDTTGEGNLVRPMSADSTELSAVKGYWDHCPAAMFMVRDGPTIAEYKRTRHKRPSPKAMYEVSFLFLRVYHLFFFFNISILFARLFARFQSTFRPDSTVCYFSSKKYF